MQFHPRVSYDKVELEVCHEKRQFQQCCQKFSARLEYQKFNRLLKLSQIEDSRVLVESFRSDNNLASQDRIIFS